MEAMYLGMSRDAARGPTLLVNPDQPAAEEGNAAADEFAISDVEGLMEQIWRAQHPWDCSSAKVLVLASHWKQGPGSALHMRALDLMLGLDLVGSAASTTSPRLLLAAQQLPAQERCWTRGLARFKQASPPAAAAADIHASCASFAQGRVVVDAPDLVWDHTSSTMNFCPSRGFDCYFQPISNCTLPG